MSNYDTHEWKRLMKEPVAAALMICRCVDEKISVVLLLASFVRKWIEDHSWDSVVPFISSEGDIKLANLPNGVSMINSTVQLSDYIGNISSIYGLDLPFSVNELDVINLNGRVVPHDIVENESHRIYSNGQKKLILKFLLDSENLEDDKVFLNPIGASDDRFYNDCFIGR